MSLPEVSVLMPTYNYASYLPEAIESVLAQDFKDFELLVIDDASEDNTATVVQSYCARDGRVRFIRNPANLGMVQNWNKCLELARGEYVKYLFGDDALTEAGSLGALVALLRENPSATLAASARNIIDAKSNLVEVCRPLGGGCHRGRGIITRCLQEDANLIGEPSATMFRKQHASPAFDPKYRQIVDLEMWFRLLEQGDLAYTGEALCAFRRHSRQQSLVNDELGVTWKEQRLFFNNYAMRPWIPQSARCSALFASRRRRRAVLRRSAAEAVPVEIADSERRLVEQLGPGGWFTYGLFLACYKIAHPFQNLERSMMRRIVRQPRPGRVPLKPAT